MAGRRQLICTSVVLCIFSLLNLRTSFAEQPSSADSDVNNVYDSLLQREYAGPVVFPNHQVERKAQRSPSLRLRFGRRNDPDLLMLPTAEKRWWGDVHQKPIRSPSLRLRFGKRDGLEGFLSDVSVDEKSEYPDNGFDNEFERLTRKPQRLRWGRSVPFDENESDLNELIEEDSISQQQQRQRASELLNRLLMQDRMLKNLYEVLNYDFPPTVNTVNNAISSSEEADAEGGFQREVRKPGPLRLRWGRSTGGVGSVAAPATATATAQPKVAISAKNTITGQTQSKN